MSARPFGPASRRPRRRFLGKRPGNRPWNANIHYQRLVVEQILPGARNALDVGCGDGLLATALAEHIPRVVAVDADPPVLERAHRRAARDRPQLAPRISWVRADVMTPASFEESFDLVASIATLHHLPDTAAGLRRMAELTRPGGRLVVVGFARTEPADLPRDLVGRLCLTALNLVRRKWEHSAPTQWPPPLTYRQVRRVAARELPGVRYRRLVLQRYLLVWTRPTGDSGLDH